eukprot:Partr_v1_DN28673_c0_g1_i2_m50412 putative Fanconi anemia, complementation group I
MELPQVVDETAVGKWLLEVDPRSLVSSIGSLMASLPPVSSKCRERVILFCAVVSCFLSSQSPMASLSDAECEQLVNSFVVEVNAFPIDTVVWAARSLMHAIRDHQAVDGSCVKLLLLLPKLLQLLAFYNGDDGPDAVDGMNTRVFKDHIVKSICTSSWHSRHVIALVGCFKEVDLNVSQLALVMRSSASYLGDLGLNEMPALAYQLLVLSKRGHRDFALNGLLEVLKAEDEKCAAILDDADRSMRRRDLNTVEGTIILHVISAMKQDQALANEFVNIVKSLRVDWLTPLHIALVLAMTQIFHFEMTSCELMKSILVKTFKRAEKIRLRTWIRELVSCHAGHLQMIIMDVTERCVNGWDQVTQGLVFVAFYLLDSTVSGLLARKSIHMHSA